MPVGTFCASDGRLPKGWSILPGLETSIPSPSALARAGHGGPVRVHHDPEGTCIRRLVILSVRVLPGRSERSRLCRACPSSLARLTWSFRPSGPSRKSTVVHVDVAGSFRPSMLWLCSGHGIRTGRSIHGGSNKPSGALRSGGESPRDGLAHLERTGGRGPSGYQTGKDLVDSWEKSLSRARCRPSLEGTVGGCAFGMRRATFRAIFTTRSSRLVRTVRRFA